MVITQDFGSQANTQAQVVGVAYNDTAGTGFYLPGEGQGGVQIDAVNLQTGAVSSTQTWDSGGYELPLAPGQYRIIASLNDTVIQTSNVTVNNLNIEQDFILTNTWQGGTREAAIAAAQPPVAPPVTIPMTPPTPVTQLDQRRRNSRNRDTELSAVDRSREHVRALPAPARSSLSSRIAGRPGMPVDVD